MEPSNFAESNCTLDTPAGCSVDQVEPLRVYRGECVDGTPVVISCWKVTVDELAEVQRTGRVWVTALGLAQPPIAVSGHHPFAQEGSDG